MLLNGKMRAFFQLIRWVNLVIIAVTMIVVRYIVVKPLLAYREIDLQIESWVFNIIIFSTLSITAAGYIINDFFDIEIDKINKPAKKHFKENTLYTLYWIFNIVGLGGACFLYIYFKNINIFIFFLMVSGALWFYSSQYKKQLIVGNLIVATLTALVPIMVLWFDMFVIKNKFGEKLQLLNIDLSYIIWWIAGFSFFAFLLTMIREITKDIEDFEGDKAYGCNTMPVVFGVHTTKTIIIALSSIVIALLIYIYINYLSDKLTLIYIASFLILPLIFTIYKLIVANNQKHYNLISLLFKLIMVFGICYAFVAWYILENNI